MLFVVRVFLLADVHWQIGDTFPHLVLSVSPKLSQLSHRNCFSF